MNISKGGTIFAAALIAGTAIAWSNGIQAQRSETRQSTKANAKLPSPVVDTHELMELFNKPLYDLLKERMQKEPADKSGWKTIHDRGVQSAEVTNLIAIREMSDKHKAKWMQHTQTARQAGLRLAEAAKTEDWQRTKAAYQSLIRNCNECHQDIAPDHAPQLKP